MQKRLQIWAAFLEEINLILMKFRVLLHMEECMKNNIRFDLSDYLIHFFRDVDLNSDSPVNLPEHCGFNSQHHANLIDARYLLRLSLRNYKLFSSWSYRNGQRTVYGDSPAVCFTDMPIAAYLDTGIKRLGKNEKIGLYALVFPKAHMFSVGARPAIYALDETSSINCYSRGRDERIIDESMLPLIEQYRYVTYVPQKIDWTHEREWRWPYRGDIKEYLNQIDEYGIPEDVESTPGLDLSLVNMTGGGVIVPFLTDIPIITHDILTLIDRGVINRGAFKFIIAMENLHSLASIFEPDELLCYINDNAFEFDGFFDLPDSEVKRCADAVMQYVDDLFNNECYFNTNFPIEYGNAWVWIQDNQSPTVRALVQAGLIRVNKEGRYLLDIKLGGKDWVLKKKEAFASHVAEWLESRFDLQATRFSVANYYDYDRVPYYCKPLEEQHPFYNNTINVDW